MRITQVESQLLRLPLSRPITSLGGRDPDNRLDHVFVLFVYLDTDAGHRGLGFAYTLGGGGRALKTITDDDLAPLVAGEDPFDHERLAAKIYWQLQPIGRYGLVAQAYSAIDVALWDLKGKIAGLPLYKLLGGARESAPAYAADTGWLWMSPDEIIEASQPLLEQGMMGIKVKVGNTDPELDAERVTRVREVLGEDIWLAVDANQRYDYATALSMGHFFEEEIGADWFEEPLSCEDVDGHARLAEKLEIALALGETLFAREEFHRYLQRGAVDIVQPDVTRLGGLTPWLKVATLAEQYQRPIAPHVLPEIAVHLACGLPQVRMVEYMPWLYPAFVEVPALVEGRIVPSKRPGLGLELRQDAVEKYRMEV
ncbi:MAG TPA: mandelate racemase/muconate lactonizing enzyme family protein [Gemmataceae bacterium]|nr:mandelate racemase/muconate lactonizing enzyme family protein [Gemmataceae bacterium]